jgi:TolB protein
MRWRLSLNRPATVARGIALSLLESLCLTCLFFLNCLFFMSSVPAWAQRLPYPASKHGGNYMFNYYIPPAPSSTPWAPCWSPDGKWIAFGMYGSIWKVEPQGGTAVELTYNRKYHSSPAWSPDGNWIVYTSDDDSRTIQLEIVNVKTGASHALTDDEQIYLDPVFSPDGSQLAYVSTRPNGFFNIYVRPIKEGQLAGQETALTRDHSYSRDRLYFGSWDMHIEPAWFPNGREILLVSNRDIPLGSGDIWRKPVESDGFLKANRVLNEQTLYRTRPDVSPDGKRFIYSSTAGAADQYNHLYVLPVEGGVPYKLTFGSFDDFHPRWSPDGEWVVYISNSPPAPSAKPDNYNRQSAVSIRASPGLPQLWLLETYGGAQRRVALRELHWKRPMGKVLVQVRDAKTMASTAARIYGLASDGKFYPPRQSYSRIGTLDEHVFHSEGEFTMVVPPGKLTLEAVKGFEYWPATQEVLVKPGTTSQALLILKPMVDMAARGWMNGSTHVHMNYGGNLHNTLENLMMMSHAEDQDVVNELIANKDNRVLDWQYFVPGGGEHPVSRKDSSLTVIVGEEYRPPFYGHTFLIGLRDHLISPFTTGYEGTAIESLYPSNTDIFRKATAQGAAVGYVHAFSGDADPLEDSLGVAKAFPVDAALGSIHAMEWSEASGAALHVWHHALNNDLRIAAVGGEDSISNLHRTKLLGTVRTYAFVGKAEHTEAERTASTSSNAPLPKGGTNPAPSSAKEGLRRNRAGSWIEALKRGHTFFSTGPLMDFKINGRIPGDSLNLPLEGGVVSMEGQVWSIVPLKRVVIYQNGEIWKEIPLVNNGRSASFRESVTLKHSGWFSLTAEGFPGSHPIDAKYPQAATSAIKVYVGNQKIRNRQSAEYFVRWIDKLRNMAENWPGWRSQAEKDHVFAQFDEARRTYQRLAQESEP